MLEYFLGGIMRWVIVNYSFYVKMWIDCNKYFF